MKTYTKKCDCGEVLLVMEHTDRSASGGKALEFDWHRGCFTASCALASFPCPHCKRTVEWDDGTWDKGPGVGIRAECHSDDQIVTATFDATRWFRQAKDGDILDLAGCGWGGDYPADAVAEHFEDRSKSVGEMFDYIRIVSKKHDMGFECHVNRHDALAWLKKNRRKLHDRIREAWLDC